MGVVTVKWSRDQFLNFGTPVVSLGRVRQGSSNLVRRLILPSTGVCMLDYSSLRRHVQGHVTLKRLGSN